MISELARSSTIITVKSTNCSNTEREKEQAGWSEFEETNSSSEDESVEQQSCGVHVMNCSDNGDCLNKDSQSCTGTTEQYYDKDCSECQIIRRDPAPTELTMCLHAVSYKVSH